MGKKYLSYSEFRLFQTNPEEHYRRYVLGEEAPMSPEANLGRILHLAMADPQFNWIKELKDNKFEHKKLIVRKILDKCSQERGTEYEKWMSATLKDGIKLAGVLDSFDKEGYLWEYKTSENPEKWSQWIVDFHKQLSFYALIYWLNYHRFFKRIRVVYMNTKKGTVKKYDTVRSRTDILNIRKEVDWVIAEMRAKNIWEKRLSHKERSLQPLAIR